ncbi:crotonase/enoyl-CoA hydratase family protein [Neobacillus niacini]|uniref:crotonase/enoyl-CoA hydratase family protein n=1 Tax=Neobacillus niacini TaxID=86668 RepID=UPI0021CB80D3|nr:crotonase/enoyl-CoA hydratase family protein [Neobacillus niacini]MCM3766060.1 crotonase/enoyl-CoA hydratase family protein [Neobacillus niacini]
MNVLVEKNGKVCTIKINRPEVRNAVDRRTAKELADAFRAFEEDDTLHVAVLAGAGGTFCAGADLKALSIGGGNEMNPDMSKDGPMGPSRMHLSKPVIAAVSGYAVAGGFELAIWCDLRVVERDAVFGVFCRRFGVPLVDGGTQRLPRLIGMSRAMDLILTGRPVEAEEAWQIGLANRVVEPGTAKDEAEKLAAQIAEFPQTCMLSDREAAYRGFDLDFDKGMQLEFLLGQNVVNSGETKEGATRFSSGQGRHGRF